MSPLSVFSMNTLDNGNQMNVLRKSGLWFDHCVVLNNFIHSGCYLICTHGGLLINTRTIMKPAVEV